MNEPSKIPKSLFRKEFLERHGSNYANPIQTCHDACRISGRLLIHKTFAMSQLFSEVLTYRRMTFAGVSPHVFTSKFALLFGGAGARGATS